MNNQIAKAMNQDVMNILTPINGSSATLIESDDQVVIADGTATVNVVSGDSDAGHEDGLILRETYMKEFSGGKKKRRHSRSSPSEKRTSKMQGATTPTAPIPISPNSKNQNRLTQAAIEARSAIAKLN